MARNIPLLKAKLEFQEVRARVRGQRGHVRRNTGVGLVYALNYNTRACVQ